MATIATSLSKALPKPKFTDEGAEFEEDEALEVPKAKTTRVVGPGVIDESQIVLRKRGPPPYGNRTGWRPRSQEDYGDGGAFPEVPVAQYPLDMGRKTTGSSNSLALQVDDAGKLKYDAIARRGHDEKRGALVQASFKDLIPLRQRADVGEISLERPSEEEITDTKERTQMALAKLVSGAVAAQKPKNVKGMTRKDPTFVRYTPANQMGDTSKKQDRIIKIVERQQDPLEPPKFKHKKIPRGPPSPPAPILHSPPRKLTAEDQEAWKIPPPVSNWKNPKGFTVPLDKRLAADGRGLRDFEINDNFSKFAEALYQADRHAREEVQQRAAMQQRLAQREKMQKEEHLRELAQKAREEQANSKSPRKGGRRYSRNSRSRSRSVSSDSSYSSRSRSADSEEDREAREREEARKERRREAEREMRQSRMGHERKLQMMAREQGRDISEKIALGLAKPTAGAETMYDSRLFNQTSGFDTGFNEDQPYDKPLFAAQEAIQSIYRPSLGADDEEDGEETLDKIQKSSRFEVLGKAGKGFKGAADIEARSGPVQFESAVREEKRKQEAEPDASDPFGVNDMISEVTGGSSGSKGKKRYGLNEAEDRSSKRPRIESDDED
ncbi:hypothetical protein NA57DRAFT_72858 [Rhizodiscina lignyota]|uniref:Pre-mRNA-processing protein 45 n=1 Tax=Rhizodiscina lignyota TaxID=1504668 RepID=A0A9P4ILG4_9PEZI|nr:hypothetical protein NA57DRAFT_72858 [Rhizodiscina lignyota]